MNIIKHLEAVLRFPAHTESAAKEISTTALTDFFFFPQILNKRSRCLWNSGASVHPPPLPLARVWDSRKRRFQLTWRSKFVVKCDNMSKNWINRWATER